MLERFYLVCQLQTRARGEDRSMLKGYSSLTILLQISGYATAQEEAASTRTASMHLQK